MIYNSDCIGGMREYISDNMIDLTVTSPPYNIGISYSHWDDKMPIDEYWSWCTEWLSEVYRCLKPDGRIALNCLYEANFKDNGGRMFIASEFWQIMRSVGFQWAGLVHLKEDKAHRVKHSAWGSYDRVSSPYLYNAHECVLIGYKEQWKKVGDKDHRVGKDIFLEGVQGSWNYRAVTKQLTKANFSEQIPEKAIQMLTYPDDIVMDPFLGSGTTAAVAKRLGRRYVGFEISPDYYDIACKRVEETPYDLKPF